MGNVQSPPSDPRFPTARRAFTKQELDDLRSLFGSLASQSRSNSKFISQSVFQDYFGIRGVLGDRMFDLVTNERKDGMLTFEDLVIAKGIYEKGSREEIEEYIYQLCNVTADGILTRSDLQIILASMMETIFASDRAESCLGSDDVNLDIFLDTATFENELDGSSKILTFVEFKKWCGLVPSVRKFLGSLLMPSGRLDFHVPRLQYPEALSSNMLTLKKEFAWHIGGALSQHEVEEWKLLYHSAVHGLSFNTFLASLLNRDGPTLLVIKDKEDCIYGGYASQPWDKHSTFYGDMKSFMFSLYPKASIFRPTGKNSNIQWCAVNFSSDSIPNGIGFGGKSNHLGLFISASLEEGHTYTCTTFDSPCLSKTNRIQPEVIECWGIVTKTGSQDGPSDGVKGTVLERFKEDRNMLNMVGLANSSE
ncbi:Oxidation resistance protein 1 [Zostera marina]|uniref:Oxidation resistance protein 1 n=1 Tax=Zostera marina TaxID=29655 RepID=A0A0K9Q2Q8_ZOSMR|nr:Oxidation resistance protein 1 [Zostera marina]